MDFLNKNCKLIALISCLVVIVGCFAPFANVLGVYINYASGDGKFVIIATIISGILIILKKKKSILIPNIIATLIYVYTTIKVTSIDLVSLGLGFYLILIGLIGIMIYPFLRNK